MGDTGSARHRWRGWHLVVGDRDQASRRAAAAGEPRDPADPRHHRGGGPVPRPLPGRAPTGDLGQLRASGSARRHDRVPVRPRSRCGGEEGISVRRKLIATPDDELLTVGFLGVAILTAGVAEDLGVSDAIGAFLAGTIVAATVVAPRVERLVLPLRDAFAAIFFFAFGLSLDPGDAADVLPVVLAAVGLSFVLNTLAGVAAARLIKEGPQAAARIGLTVLARGEFSLILASLAAAAGLDPRIRRSSGSTSSSSPSLRRSSRRSPTDSPRAHGDEHGAHCSMSAVNALEGPRPSRRRRERTARPPARRGSRLAECRTW